jgi:hypothetical protein
MSLKTDYFDNLTGLHQKMNAAYDAGVAFVVANSTLLSADLKSAAEQGKTKFDVGYVTSFNNAWLRGNNGDNLLKKAYFAGVQSGLADSQIYSYECTLALDVSDSVSTKVKFQFNFQTT